MYKTLLAAKNTKLLFELQTLDIWGEQTGFELAAAAHDIKSTLQTAEKGSFDLIVTELFDTGFDSFIKELKDHGCHNIIAVSEELTLENARKCIINHTNDYFVLPFEKQSFIETLERIRRSVTNYRDDINVYASELSQLFCSQDNNFLKRINETAEKIYSTSSEKELSDRTAKKLLENTAEMIFEKNEWLDLYINKEDIFIHYENIGTKQFFITSLTDFFDDFSELYPAVQNDKILKVILYILNNPESDLKQKSIAASLYMNSSYLSTVFTAHTQQRFVDYLTNVKLRRAAWLLRNTNLKITDIAERLDYKDMGYFSRLFKKKYGITPSDYRIPDNYNYYI